MKSISFPKMFTKTTTKVVSDKDATVQNLKTLLSADKLSEFGDPYFGAGLRKYLFEPGDSIIIDIIIDAVYTAIVEFMPQLYVNRNDISVDIRDAKVYITITAMNKIDYQTNLYDLVLFDGTNF